MFERYTETARRVIFFARYECSLHGSPVISSEYLLLGLLREVPERITHYLSIRHSDLYFWLASRDRLPPISTSVDLPLGDDGKRVLDAAAQEAEFLGDPSIRPEHLLLGILREQSGVVADMLRGRGAPATDAVRATIAAENAAAKQPGAGMP